MNPRKIAGVVFTVVYLTATLNQTSCIKLVTRGNENSVNNNDNNNK